MAWSIEAGDWIRAEVHGTCQGQEILNQADYLCFFAGATPPDSAAAGLDFVTRWLNDMCDFMPTEYEPVFVRLKKISGLDYTAGPPQFAFPEASLVEDVAFPSGSTGFLGGGSHSLQVTATVKRQTNGGGDTTYWPVGEVPAPAVSEKKFRGRTSMSPLSVELVNAANTNYLTLGGRFNFQNQWNSLILWEVGLDPDWIRLNMVVVSIYTSGIVRKNAALEPIVAMQGVASHIVNPFVGSMDSRKPH